MVILDAGLTFRGPEPSGGTQKVIDTIIIHHRAGNGDVQSIHAQHQAQGWWGIGYHYYIRKDGTVWRGRPEKFVGSHAGSKTDYNYHSIGICFEGNFETERMTDPQVAAGRDLIADIKSRHPINKILKHKDVAATVCPGKNIRWEELLASAPEPMTAVKVGNTTVEGRRFSGMLWVPLESYNEALMDAIRGI